VQFNFSRVARTDKGVHAAGQVVSLRMRVVNTPEGREAARKAVNEHLPPTVRCLWIVRVTKGFDARHTANGRRYEYLLPTSVLRPRPKTKFFVSSLPQTSELDPSVRSALVEAMKRGDMSEVDRLQREGVEAAQRKRAERLRGKDMPLDMVVAQHRAMRAGMVQWGRARGAGAQANAVRAIASAAAGPSVVSNVSYVGRMVSLAPVGEGHFVQVVIREAHILPGEEAVDARQLVLPQRLPKFLRDREIDPETGLPRGMWVTLTRLIQKSKPFDECELAPAPLLPTTEFSRPSLVRLEAIASARCFQVVPGSVANTDQLSVADALRAAVGRRQCREAARVRVERDRRWGYRIDGATLAKLRYVCGMYKGTVSFHNFTPHLTYGDVQVLRVMKSVTVSDPFLVSRTGILPGMTDTDRDAVEATMKAMIVARVREHKMARRRRMRRKQRKRTGRAAAEQQAKQAKLDEEEGSSSSSSSSSSSAAAAEAAKAEADKEDEQLEEGVNDPLSTLYAQELEEEAALTEALNIEGEIQEGAIEVTDEEVEAARKFLKLETPRHDIKLLTQQDLEEAGPDYAMEFVRFTVIGQSFLLNQIRHMVGLAIDYARGACNSSVVDMVFGPYLTWVPLAPAEGLFLHTAYFDKYNRRLPPAREPLDFESAECAERQRQFKEQFIWGHIARQCAVEEPFERWLETLTARPANYKLIHAVDSGSGANSRSAMDEREYRTAHNITSRGKRGAKVGGRGRSDSGRGDGRGRGRGRGRGDDRGRGRGGRGIRRGASSSA
jgi:tRNA U38,U39,U40 pseudouridine synthase TruA